MYELNTFWNWFVIIITVGSILGCWWLLHWTKGVGDEKDGKTADDTGHVWDDNIHELNTPLPRWWLYLFNITIVFALIYLAFYPGLGNFAGKLGWTQENQYEAEIAAAHQELKAIQGDHALLREEVEVPDGAIELLELARALVAMGKVETARLP